MDIILRHIAAFRQLEYLDVSDSGAVNTLEPWVSCRELQMLILASRSLEWLRGVDVLPAEDVPSTTNGEVPLVNSRNQH
jgi:hypothetical protein